jgi:hypothetical protein
MNDTLISQQQLASPGSKHNPASPVSDGQDENSSDESGADGGSLEADGSRKRRRTGNRPLSVSCETCKQRKVKCDRGRPSCGWCLKNNQPCEYRERKKPGLRAVHISLRQPSYIYLSNTVLGVWSRTRGETERASGCYR